MADFDQDTYKPQDGDLYIQEVKAGRFTIYRYSFGSWEQLGAGHSEQDIKRLIAPMESLGESKGKRQYYRPTGQAYPHAEIEKIALDRYRIRSHGQLLTVSAEDLLDIYHYVIEHVDTLTREAIGGTSKE